MNFLVSAGNYFAMSGESNIGCKYIHYAWHLHHSSRTSDVNLSVTFQLLILSSNGALKGENDMASVLTMCSSKVYYISSYPLMMWVIFL